MGERRKLIRASEVGEYVFCARAWRLRLDGHEPTAGRHAREAGTAWHLTHGRSVRRARRLKLVAACASFLAVVVAVLILLSWWWR
jgi:hypothetical protein